MATKKTSLQKRAAYAVEWRIPIPAKKYNKIPIYPFEKMKVGDSTLISNKTYGAIAGSLRKHKADDKQFIIRTVDGGLRVWRTI